MKNSPLSRQLCSTVAMILLLSICTQAQKALQGPYFIVSGGQTTADQFPLLSTDVEVEITGPIARVVVVQTYQNNGEVPIEAQYVFPASTQAAVHGMKMKIDDRVIEARIEKREKAREDYENAISEGKMASLLEQERPNVFELSVSNIVPGKSIEVELQYSEYLQKEDGTFEFMYPTIVGPRYVGQEAPLTQEEEFARGGYQRSGETPLSLFSIRTQVEAPFPVMSLISPSHNIVTTRNGSAMIAELSPEESKSGNRDYILRYSAQPEETGAAMLVGSVGAENYFMLSIEAPAQIEDVAPVPKEYIFMLDVSGSMNGFPLELSKKVMNNVLEQLQPTDLFNVLLFAGGSDYLFPESRPATKENIHRYKVFLRDYSGSGGTELLSAIRESMSIASGSQYSRSFVILTDGYVTVERDCFEYIQNHLGEANFFALGIGTSVNRYIIEGIGRAGGGFHDVIEKTEGSDEKASRFIESITNPVMTDIQLSFEGMKVEDLEPAQIQDLFVNSPITVTGKFVGTPEGVVKVHGVSGSGPTTYAISINQDNVLDEGEVLSQLWARKKLESMSDMASNKELEERETEITAIGLEHNILTKYTSFVAIDTERSTEGGEPVRIRQPLPMPQGVSNKAIGLQSAMVMHKSSVASVQIEACEIVMADAADEYFFSLPESEPEYPGGDAELKNDIQKAIRYPEEARNAGLEGTVYVKVTINKDGVITKVRVLRGAHPLLDAEAERVVRQLKPFIPGTYGDTNVRSKLVIPVKFSLN